MGWTWVEGVSFKNAFKGVAEEDQEAEMDQRTPRIEKIAKQISDLKRDRERSGWDRQARYEDDSGYSPEEMDADNYSGPEEFNTPEYAAAVDRYVDECKAARDLATRIEDAKEALEIEMLEDELHSLGARMMRPYEHHNEDEDRIRRAEGE